MNTTHIAQQTLAALEQGRYTVPDGATVEIAALLATCLAGTRCYDPAELAAIAAQIVAHPQDCHTTFAVTNETTLAACARLATDHPDRHIGVLNFASAKNPGGGFLKGAQAQEESLARSSGLYPSLLRCPAFYAFHRAQDTCLYSDRMIYTPACPVIRDDAGNWRARPYIVNVITSPAPNAGAIMRNEPEQRQAIITTLRERAGKVLALAANQGCDMLVLGAWGCGVFQNDPADVARVFWEHLQTGGAFGARFAQVIFAVYDTSRTQATYAAFARQFDAGCPSP